MDVDEHPAKIVKVLYFSLRNLRKNISQIDMTQKKLQITATQMKRTSYLSELELNYIYALHARGFNVGAGSNFFILMTEYMDLFYDKSDVVVDLRPYLKLLNADQDVDQMKERLMDRVQQHEEMENEVDGHAKLSAPISLRVLRWRFVLYKVNRILGVNSLNSDDDKLDLVNKLFGCFLQAMEYHPQASSNVGVGMNHTQHVSPNEAMTELDRKNAEDILIIAVETLYEVKLYDFTVLNPVNFMMICMLEHSLQYYPESVRVCSWLLKVYSKLGLASLVTDLVEKFPYINDLNFERLGASRFSVYADYGMNDSLEELIQEYKDFYRDKINDNKNTIVTAFLHRDFENIQPTM